eukprot:GHVR01114148.1.p1 GENE.GHVR01114148.1~~GHVR01114148.1.p1  ORF type:complete len:140 (+),score=22.74 GHVR01114148.1:172-591(+)
MMDNLKARGCSLLGLLDYPTLQSQVDRFHKLGWPYYRYSNMNDIYENYIDQNDVYRVQKVELFDELEEWRLIQNHYYIGIAVKTPESSGECEPSESLLSDVCAKLLHIFELTPGQVNPRLIRYSIPPGVKGMEPKILQE